ncbi:MAG: helix-turn-helix transcriptional regulator [Lachnospiraceae bacterium]|nr:helix-turn-helix transcriptional regulator [Lachnospiraceae bacterium]
MKQRKETFICNAFTVDTLVTVYHLKMSGKMEQKQTKEYRDDVYDFWQLVYLESGQYSCCIRDNVLEPKAGQLILAEPGQERITVKEKDAVVAIISFRCNSDKMLALKNRVFGLTGEEKELLFRILRTGIRRFKVIGENQSYYGQQPEEGTTDYEVQTVKNYLELLLISIYENRDAGNGHRTMPRNQSNYYETQFAHMEAFMKENLSRNITIEDIVRYTGFSESTIKRICTSCVGCGAVHHFIGLKMEEAKRLIRESDLTISQISEKLGFSGIHYFSRIFKKRNGITPTQYAHSVWKK